MKSLVLLALLIMLLPLYVPSVPVHASPTRLGGVFGVESAQVLTVWFDAAPQLTIAYPPAYLFNVAAKTASGLWITSLHWDFGDGATLDVPFSGQSQVSDIRAHQYATQANYCVTVTAYDSAGNTAVVSQPLMPNYDFTLTATPTTQNAVPGGSASYNVAVGSSLACSNPVPVSLVVSSPPPQGVTWTLNPASGQTPFTSTLQVQTSTNTPNGTYSISVIGSSSKFAHTATVTLIVLTPSFTLSVNPSSLLVPTQSTSQPDRTNMTTVLVQSFNGFNNAVVLTASGVPNGMSLTFSLPSVTPPPNGQATSLLTIVTPCSVTPESYAITVQGNGGGIVRQSVLNVSVSACSTEFDIFPFILAGVVGLLILLPLLFFFTRPRAVAVVPAVPFAVPVAPQVVPCPICGNPLSPVHGQWYCATCHRRIWIAP
ncbi:MAG: PKD domain-containing protein [Candidatus Bathyarchaeia archaeon]